MADNVPRLGKLAPADARRDAIHLAVIPAVALHKLSPGDPVGLNPEGMASRMCPDQNIVGIVDPFLDRPVEAGERVWVCLYPGTITTLRHVWTHPAIREENAPPPVAVSVKDKRESEAWLRQFADEVGIAYVDVISAGDAYVDHGDLFCQGDRESARNAMADADTRKAYWSHWQIVTGRTVPPATTEGRVFSCSC